MLLTLPLWHESVSTSVASKLPPDWIQYSSPLIGQKRQIEWGTEILSCSIVYAQFLTKGSTAVRWDHYPSFQNVGEEIQMQLWKHFVGHFEEKPTYSFGSRVKGSLYPELTLVISLLLRPYHSQQPSGRASVKLTQHQGPQNTRAPFLFHRESVHSRVGETKCPGLGVSELSCFPSKGSYTR